MLDHLHRATVDGADIRYLRVGRGRSIVLLHTLRTQLEYFDRLLEHVDTNRVEVIAIDLPGHGESSAPAVEYTAGYFTDTVGALLDMCDGQRAVLVGQSLGWPIRPA